MCIKKIIINYENTKFINILHYFTEGDTDFSNCRWSKVKQAGNLPTARCSLSSTQVTGHNKAYLFGGVYDEEKGEDDLHSTFYNDLFMLDMEQNTPTWRLSIIFLLL